MCAAIPAHCHLPLWHQAGLCAGTTVVHSCLLCGLLECKMMKCDASLLAGKEYSVGRRCARRWTALESFDTSPWTGFHAAISYH